MTIQDFIKDNDIIEVLHFTTERGLTGCASKKEVLSRKALDEEQYLSHIATPVSSERKEAQATFNKDENWLDYINMSIGEINTHYFRSAIARSTCLNRWWCIMSFEPILLTHDGVYFTTTNNIYTGVKRASGISGLRAMYSENITRWYSNVISRNGRHKSLPTCEQAEVLYPNPLSLDYLRCVYVQDLAQAASIHGTLVSLGFQDVDVIICPDKFSGVPNI